MVPPIRSLAALLVLLLPGCALLRTGARQPEGYLVTPGEGRIFYRFVGRGPDTVVVLHDGPGLHMNATAGDLSRLARRYTLLLYDQRGGGRSDRGEAPPVRMDTDWVKDPLLISNQVRDLETVRNHFGMQKVTLLGHGWGAGIAAQYAVDRPERVERLILLSPIPPSRNPYVPEMESRLRERLGADSARLDSVAAAWKDGADPRTACTELFRIRYGGTAASPRASRRIRARPCDAPDDALRRFPENSGRALELLRSWKWQPTLFRISAPTLVVRGEHDPAPPEAAQEWARTIPGARLLEIPGAGAFPHAERPGLFFPALERFLAGAESDTLPGG